MTEPAPPSPSTPRAFLTHQIPSEAPNGAPPAAAAASSKPQQQRGPPPGEKKVLTKAERRDIQERQRAEKEALKAQNAKGGGVAKPKPTPQPAASGGGSAAPATPARQRGVARASADTPAPVNPRVGLARRSSIAGPSDLAPVETLRIFSHFGLPKPLSKLGEGIRGEIHPVIRKLGLQFADFRIVGANARCIATLTAFKTVRCACPWAIEICVLILLSIDTRSFKTTLLLGVQRCPATS